MKKRNFPPSSRPSRRINLSLNVHNERSHSITPLRLSYSRKGLRRMRKAGLLDLRSRQSREAVEQLFACRAAQALRLWSKQQAKLRAEIVRTERRARHALQNTAILGMEQLNRLEALELAETSNAAVGVEHEESDHVVEPTSPTPEPAIKLEEEEEEPTIKTEREESEAMSSSPSPTPSDATESTRSPTPDLYDIPEWPGFLIAPSEEAIYWPGLWILLGFWGGH